MPKSRRDKPQALTKVKKHTRVVKDRLLSSIRDCSSTYPSIYVFQLHHPRNARLKQMRDEWAGSRFFLGKTRVMQAALGHSPSDEPAPHTSSLTPYLTGQRGLLFTSTPHADVLAYFAAFAHPHFARSGAIAAAEVRLEKGPLSADVAPHAMEPRLRKLGLPTRLRGGVVELQEGVVVCREGDVLTPEQCRLLEVFGEKMAVMRVDLVAWWRREGGKGEGGVVEELREGVEKDKAAGGGEDWKQRREAQKKKGKRGVLEEHKQGQDGGEMGEDEGEEGEEGGEEEEGGEDDAFVPEPMEGWGEVAVPSY